MQVGVDLAAETHKQKVVMPAELDKSPRLTEKVAEHKISHLVFELLTGETARKELLLVPWKVHFDGDHEVEVVCRGIRHTDEVVGPKMRNNAPCLLPAVVPDVIEAPAVFVDKLQRFRNAVERAVIVGSGEKKPLVELLVLVGVGDRERHDGIVELLCNVQDSTSPWEVEPLVEIRRVEITADGLDIDWNHADGVCTVNTAHNPVSVA